MQKRFLFYIFILVAAISYDARGEDVGIASSAYVKQIVDALGVPALSEGLATHTSDTDNPHAVTAAQVGLGNVKDVDTTNADNLTAGTVNIARLPVGATDGTVAAGTDMRFDTVSTTEPVGTPPSGRVYVWFN